MNGCDMFTWAGIGTAQGSQDNGNVVGTGKPCPVTGRAGQPRNCPLPGQQGSGEPDVGLEKVPQGTH